MKITDLDIRVSEDHKVSLLISNTTDSVIVAMDPVEAEDLGSQIIKCSADARIHKQRAEERELRRKGLPKVDPPPPPVDRSQKELLGGMSVPDNNAHLQINPATGMQRNYVVLSAEERAKGFVRPVRKSYKHVGLLPPTNLRTLSEAEREQHAGCNYVGFEEYGEDHPRRQEGSSVIGRYWTQSQLDRVRAGCGSVTWMALEIAETLARDPGFYSGGYCAGCHTHFPNEEFVWDGTEERVGS